jgi:hypothetical protein
MSTPPGWEPKDPTTPVGFAASAGYECKRIHLGTFERGPIRIVWDGHNNADVPPDCSKNEPQKVVESILNVMLVDDDEVAAYLKSRFGMPVLHGDIQEQSQAAGQLVEHTWSWDSGQGASQLVFPSDGTNQSRDGAVRIFWQNGTGIGALDLVETRFGTRVSDRAGYGTMKPPMLLANLTAGLFTGTVGYNHYVSTEGTFQSFADYQCKERGTS